MSEPLPDTWDHRDLPVLRAVVRLFDEHLQPVAVDDVEEATGLSEDDVQRAGVALGRAALVDTLGAWGRPVLRFTSVNAEARRLAGSWPTPETGVERLIAALENLAEHGTEDERTRAQKILDALSGAGQQIAVSVASAVITGQIT